MKNIVGRENMIQFDALRMYNKDEKYSDTMLVDEIPEVERKALARQVAVYKKYNDIFDVDDVPEAERMATARQVADYTLGCLDRGEEQRSRATDQHGCCGNWR